MADPRISNIGAYIKPVAGTPPAAASAATRTSSAINRLVTGSGMYQSCVLTTDTGVTSGSPTSFTVNAKIQHSADGSTGWADYTPPGGAAADAAITAITAASTQEKKSIDLSGAYQYVRISETVAFVGGTAPTVGACSKLILGGAPALPAA
jgi:hypothetical protein